jgi:hypothetical protein
MALRVVAEGDACVWRSSGYAAAQSVLERVCLNVCGKVEDLVCAPHSRITLHLCEELVSLGSFTRPKRLCHAAALAALGWRRGPRRACVHRAYACAQYVSISIV